ncbi:MAG: hypothetical protein O2931_06745 [Planctomycetota bacterium]|nr:hypothetical protein [Planctomycetota bacterium]MDA1178477.1 hypothetical protein [Planctomycetota bacterium]
MFKLLSTRSVATALVCVLLGNALPATEPMWGPSVLELPSPARAGQLDDRPQQSTQEPATSAAGEAPPSYRSSGSPSPEVVSAMPHRLPATAAHTTAVPFDSSVFSQDPHYDAPLVPDVETSIYGGKYLVPTQRPWIEWFRGMYQPGPIPESTGLFGTTNPTAPHFLLYGDYRSGIGYVDQGGQDKLIAAQRLNLDLDLKLTGTERIHAFIGPLDRGANITRWEYDDGDVDFFEEFDSDFDTFFFEGDLGALWGGMRGKDSPFDIPFAAGYIPLFFQNGIWAEDAMLGAAVTLPAKNSATFDWANFDLTFFVGWDELDSPAFPADDSAAQLYGFNWFLEAYGGYFEIGYAFLDDQVSTGRSYHNTGFAYTRRWRDRLSYSIRYLSNFGQDSAAGAQTADGQLFLFESSLITRWPSRIVPYFNLFAGFDRPQSLARAGVAGGVLRNTGINFETDGLTGFPTLDPTGPETIPTVVPWESSFWDRFLIIRSSWNLPPYRPWESTARGSHPETNTASGCGTKFLSAMPGSCEWTPCMASWKKRPISQAGAWNYDINSNGRRGAATAG